MPKKSSILSLELMRIIAAFFVIFNHTSSVGHFLFSRYSDHSIQYWPYMLIAAFCHFSVPLFFMISGALLLGRDDEMRQRNSLNKALHILLVLLVWSFVYYLSAVYDHSQYLIIARDEKPYLSFVQSEIPEFSIKSFLIRVLVTPGWNHSFWYLYAYIAFLLCLPMLQHMAHAFTRNDFIRLFLLYAIVFMLVPALQFEVGKDQYNFGLSLSGLSWVGSNVLIFPLTGYFLQHRLKENWTRKRILIMWGINFVGLFYSCHLTHVLITRTGNVEEVATQAFLPWSVIINAVSVFATCQYLEKRTSVLRTFEKPLCYISNATFGIYLSHLYFLHRIWLAKGSWQIFCGYLHVGPMAYALIYCALVFLCSLVTTKILQRVPVLKRLVA